jgi:hypothetical protein
MLCQRCSSCRCDVYASTFLVSSGPGISKRTIQLNAVVCVGLSLQLFTAAQTQLALHCGETTIQMPFTPEQGKSLDAALSKLLQTFAEKQGAARPKR